MINCFSQIIKSSGFGRLILFKLVFISLTNNFVVAKLCKLKMRINELEAKSTIHHEPSIFRYNKGHKQPTKQISNIWNDN